MAPALWCLCSNHWARPQGHGITPEIPQIPSLGCLYAKLCVAQTNHCRLAKWDFFSKTHKIIIIDFDFKILTFTKTLVSSIASVPNSKY